MGNLVFQATLGGQVNLVGPNTASTFNLNVPAVSATLATTDANTFTAAQTFTAGSAAAPAITTSGDTNTGIFFPAADTIAFAEGGVEAMRLDSSGNMGLGVTPSAWSVLTGLQVKNAGVWAAGTDAGFVNNGYFNGSSWRYIASSSAALYQTTANVHAWYNAPSGTAGNAISFTQAMTLDASGNLGLGTTSPSFKLEVTATKDNVRLSASQAGQMLAMVQSSANPVIMRMTNNSSNFWDTQVNTDNSISWDYNDSERARIDSSGNLLVGTTSAYQSGKFVAAWNGDGGTGGVVLQNTGTGTGGQYAVQFFYNSTTRVGSIQTTGTATFYVTSSDYRLKENVAPMTGALATVAQLKPCTYTWKSTGSAGQGFIAHELQEVVPDCVTGEKNAVNEDGSIKPQGIDTSFLVATLTAAIQELKAEFDAYKASHP
jgi:hypothetical protein